MKTRTEYLKIIRESLDQPISAQEQANMISALCLLAATIALARSTYDFDRDRIAAVADNLLLTLEQQFYLDSIEAN